MPSLAPKRASEGIRNESPAKRRARRHQRGAGPRQEQVRWTATSERLTPTARTRAQVSEASREEVGHRRHRLRLLWCRSSRVALSCAHTPARPEEGSSAAFQVVALFMPHICVPFAVSWLAETTRPGAWESPRFKIWRNRRCPRAPASGRSWLLHTAEERQHMRNEHAFCGKLNRKAHTTRASRGDGGLQTSVSPGLRARAQGLTRWPPPLWA